MRLLLDTHAFLWFNADDARLGARARAAITDGSNEVLLSSAVAWEIAIKHARGRLPELQDTPESYIHSRIGALSLEPLPITIAHAVAAGGLPEVHADPFDRMLIAQALTEGVPILTSDPQIASYDVETIW